MMMNDNFQMALASIRTNRLRSLLTMLGIIIGVVGVITSAGIGEGVKRQVSRETSKLGQDVVSIRPGSLLSRDKSGLINGINTLASSSRSGSVLTSDDLEAIQKILDVNTAVPLSLVSGLPKTETRDFPDGAVIGTTTNLPGMLQQQIEFGGFFGSEDDNKKVAVIGTKVAEKLFGEFAPLGETFSLRGEEFIVRGVFENFESSSLSQGIDFNNALFIPYTTAESISGGSISFYEILAKLNDEEKTAVAVAAITEELKASRGGEEDFTILRANETLASTNTVVQLITTMVIVVAVIAMVVGGIGIMNVMLVSVTERTREIGIRKAVGASDAQIGTQFLIEATTLSVWGAAIGVGLAGVVNLFLRIMTDLEPIIVWEVVVFSTVVSILIGVLFGAAPAYKAAKKDPIDALRS